MIKVWTDDNTTKVTLPYVSSYSWSYSDIDKESGRNDYGLMMRNRIASKIKLEFTWSLEGNTTEHNRLLGILKGLPVFFYCEFLDADGTTKTMECYRGDISATLYRYDAVKRHIWKEAKCNFIQR